MAAGMDLSGFPPPRSGYRPEIDGLRAVSILAVVMYHAGIPGLEAGYLGVDVFFVISGFLITDQLLREALSTGTIQMAAFYARRVRRLLPAFLAMAIGTSALALMYLVPITEQRLFGNALARSAAFYYNIALWRGGYVYDGADAGQQLLTHTWSLGVEEQFYLIWPWICLLALRFGRPLALLSTLTVTSLIGSWWCIHEDANAVFFLLPFRAWELGLGACVAVYSERMVRGREFVAPAGVGLILVALFTGRSFDGMLHAQMLAVSGAALVVLPGRVPNPASRLLGAPLLVFLGRMSYSWYLWHWPLLVMARLSGSSEEPGRVSIFVIAGFLLGAVSYAWVEVPTRTIQITMPVKILAAGAAGLLVLTASGRAMELRAERLAALPENVARLRRLAAAPVRSCEEEARNLGCVLGSPKGAGKPFILLWGDSFARALSPALSEYANRLKLNVRLVAQSACPPLVNVVPESRKRRGRPDLACAESLRTMRESIRRDSSRIDGVVLAARWPVHFSVDSSEEHRFFDQSGREIDVDLAPVLGLDEALDFLHSLGKRVLVVGAPPLFPFDVPNCLLRDRGPCLVSRSWKEESREQARRAIDTAVRRYDNARFYDLFAGLCPGKECDAGTLDEPLLSDRAHLSPAAAPTVRSMLRPALDWLIQAPP